MKPAILVIDNNSKVEAFLHADGGQNSYFVKGCHSPNEARNFIGQFDFSVIIINIPLPAEDSFKFVKDVQSTTPDTSIIAITESRDLGLAQEAVRLEFYDYLIKPLDEKNLLQVINNAHLRYLLRKEAKVLEKQKDEYRDTLEAEVKDMVRELRSSEKNYRDLIEQSIVGVALVHNGIIRFCNTKFANILGYNNTDEVTLKALNSFILSHKHYSVNKIMEGTLGKLRENATIQFPAYKKDAESIYLQAWISTMEYRGEDAILFVVTDITQQHLAQQREKKYAVELLKENKMASIGHLTSGIAHNLNTPISIIQGNAELLHLKHPDSSELEMILRQTEKMNQLIQSIILKGELELSNKESYLNLNDLITTEIDFLNANLYFKHYIETKLELDKSIPNIYGRYSDYSQTISAFIQNAIDAMYNLDKRILTVKTVRAQGQITVIIRDTGVGMTPEVVDSIFKPFFTTKPATETKLKDSATPRGNGLGLSLADKIIKKCNITVQVSSIPNKGTEFTLHIPVTSEDEANK